MELNDPENEHRENNLEIGLEFVDLGLEFVHLELELEPGPGPGCGCGCSLLQQIHVRRVWG